MLLFVASNSERGWTPEEVSQRTRLTHESVSAKLQDLHRAKLLTVEGEAGPVYRYSPTSEALAQEVALALEKAYRERKDSVIQLIYSRPLDNIRIFADAFKLKEKD